MIPALCRAGRRGEALEAYQDLHRILKRELGLEPSPELQRLQARILDSTVTELPRQPSRLPEPRSAPYGTPPFWTSTAAGRPQGRRGTRFPGGRRNRCGPATAERARISGARRAAVSRNRPAPAPPHGRPRARPRRAAAWRS
ncbi:BTAD domain-containing putative transcriptional regulator [Streptomyces achromogenes]|uniref:BTAD domain-containing putative transcriptional regulator n=1 Tax=Streptomyces achromogenes TaxID=67255 RepID=UPI0036788110